MPTFTAADLEARVRAAADSHDNFVEPAMIWAWLDREALRLDNMLLRKKLSLTRSTVDFTATGAASYTPTFTPGCLAILGVYEVDTTSGQGTRYRRLRRASNTDPPRAYTSSRATCYSAYTTPTGVVTLELFPQASSGTYRVFYAPQRAATTAGTDAFYYPAGWEELLVLGAAISALAREESGNSILSAMYRDLKPQIEAEAASFETNESAVVQNVDYLYGHADDWLTLPHLDRDEIIVF